MWFLLRIEKPHSISAGMTATQSEFKYFGKGRGFFGGFSTNLESEQTGGSSVKVRLYDFLGGYYG